MRGGGDSEGMGTSAATKMSLGPSEGWAGATASGADCGGGTSGGAGPDSHVEQQIEACPQSPLGVSPQPL